ncbi:MAG: MFS transporter [Planctomycetota bacterium]
MVRRNYAYELKSSATFPLAAALAEGTFTGVVASKYFDGGPLLIAVITAAPMFGNILALLWSELAESRRKVPFINLLQIGLVVSMAAVGLTVFLPIEGGVAGWTFAGLIIVARVIASGIVTLRSAVWRLNYPRAIRGQVIGRINGLYNFVLAVVTLAAALAMDKRPASFAIIYPVVAVISLFGVLQYSRIRVRGETTLLKRARLVPTAARPSMFLGSSGALHLDYARVMRSRVAGSAVGRLGKRIRDAFRLLREDRIFRAYQWWQFVLGSSFMLMFPTLIHVISSEMTDPDTQYVLAIFVVNVIPLVTTTVLMQAWAPVFDRTDILTFRVLLGVTACLAHSLILLGAATDQLWLVAIGMFAVGTSFGGGQLAWQLGQNSFATKGNIGTYMGLHVMLTGLRGMFVPFTGVLIYRGLGWYDQRIGWSEDGGTPLGRWLFAVSVGLSLWALFGFFATRRRYRQALNERDEEEPSTRVVRES